MSAIQTAGAPPTARRRTVDLAVFLVVNGTLGMSPGKIAAQCFQACQRLYARARDPDQEQLRRRLARWERHGTLTICRLAETEHIFTRACAELDGAVMVDEGVNEVEPMSATVLAAGPIEVASAPAVLRSKRMPLLTAAGIQRCRRQM